MTDKELLEAAAKAAGFDAYIAMYGWNEFGGINLERATNFDPDVETWNPLADDGDALRLAVRLNIPVIPYDDETSTGTVGVVAKNWGSKEANTRRAIVRAAAQMANAK